jgi:hypothetical protein
MTEREQIEDRFSTNLERVRGLVELYKGQSRGGKGRKDVIVADLLRVAVVLLHASLEDLLRSLAEWKLPTAPVSSLEKIPFSTSDKPSDKISLAELARFRGRAVDQVIADSIEKHLERSSFNNLPEILDLLGRIEINVNFPKEVKGNMAIMIYRRHWIAHRADRNSSTGPGHQAARSISLADVEKWIGAVETFGASVLEPV